MLCRRDQSIRWKNIFTFAVLESVVLKKNPLERKGFFYFDIIISFASVTVKSLVQFSTINETLLFVDWDVRIKKN